MLFRFGASLPVAQVLNPVVLVITLATALIGVTATIALTRSPRVPMKDAALGALTVVWPNTGFMGVPLLAALMGPAAAGPVITTCWSIFSLPVHCASHSRSPDRMATAEKASRSDGC
jgi:predicted permease